MASVPRRRLGLPKPSQSFSPFEELGQSGVAVFGGFVQTREKDARVFGRQCWVTFAEMLTNTSIIAAGVRYFLNIVANANWTVTPKEDKKLGGPTDEAKEVAEFVDDVINNMVTPWRRVMRRAAMYRFMGFGIQEWTALRRPDGKIGLEDIEARPQHTIYRWEVDEKGTVEGVYQTPPQTGQEIYLPRDKVFYMVEDSLTDSPEGIGLFRHMVEPYERLKTYLTLEGRGYERDLRGIPIGRVPYTAINRAVKAGAITQEFASSLVNTIETFVKTQVKQADTSIVLDSIPYVVETDSGQSMSSTMQYGVELLQGQQPSFGDVHQSIERLNVEMARIIGVEHLILGGGAGGANRALSEDKSRNFYLTVNGTLDEIADGSNDDIVATICDLNGIGEELYPTLAHSDVSFRAVSEITGALSQMAQAGAVLSPDDPAIDEIREMLGISKQPERTPEEMGVMVDTHTGMPTPQDEERQRMSMEQQKLTFEQQRDNPMGMMPPGAVPGGPQPAFGGPKGSKLNKRSRAKKKEK